jgi:VCBS repeat protein/FG-GAP repeat protein
MAALGALVMTAPAQASFTPEAGSPYTAGDSPFGLVTADFDGSGRPDVAAINGNGSTVNVYLRQTAGGFAQDTGSPFGNVAGPNFGAAADFNGDGRPDLAVANFTSTTATVFLRLAAGGFAPEAGPPNTGGRQGALATADFDGNGRPDLAVANWDSATVSVFLRQANNTFAVEGAALPVGANPRYITAADFNGDGRTDLAVSNFGSATVSVLLRQLGGGFAPEGGPIAVGTGPAGLAAADFNGDGLTDLAVANSQSSSVTVLLRQSAGGFAAEGSPIAVGAGPVGISSADFDGDGHADLAVASNSTGQVTVLLRQAVGGFAADAGSPMSVPNAYFPAAADFDGDGKPDLAVSQAAPAGAVAILLNSTPTAAPPPPPPPPAPPAPPVPGKSAVVRVVSGTVLIKLPGKRFVPLTAAANIPMGSQLDTRKGRVELTTAADTAGKKTQKAQFYDGIFQIKQSVPKKKPKKAKALITDLVMKGQIARSQCAPLKGARAAAADKKKGPKAVLGQLWGNGKGKFRTNGKYSSATVRGTIWLVQDRCEGTLTKVRRGTVAVRDFKRKKTVSVKAGHSYLARAQRAASKAKRR